MRVLLITPPYHSGVVESAGVWMNVGYVYLAGGLRDAGHEVVIYDAMALFHSPERIQKEIEDMAPDLVALTAITATINDSVAVCALAKEVDPTIKTIIGNVHPTFMWKEVLDGSPDVDFVARGEGDSTLVDLCACLEAKDDLSKVRGIAWRDDDGLARTSPPRPLCTDLDALPTAWELVDWRSYTYRPYPGSTLALVSSSRGCMQQCSFCSQRLFWKQTWRGRKPEAFVGELEMLRDTHGVSIAMLADETPTTDPVRWERILDLLIEREVGVELLMETRVDDILRDRHLMDRYKEAGISHIYVGVESTDQDTLDLFHKDIKVEESKEAIDLINQADIVSETSFVLGMPDETPERMAASLELAKHYNPDMAFFLAINPWPYADIYDSLKDHIGIEDYSQYNLVKAVVKPNTMSLEDVDAFLGHASHQFYAHKFQNLDGLSEFKRHFLVKVAAILMNHSYLAKDMKELRDKMPQWVRTMLDAIEAEEAKEEQARAQELDIRSLAANDTDTDTTLPE